MPNLTPDQETHVQHQTEICSFCYNYDFKPRPAGDTEYGQAYCRHKKEWFSDQQHGVPAGLRACEFWK